MNDPEEEGGKREVVLVKPQSYMNTSGGPISKLCAQYKVKPEELLVIHDELDIPAGDVRVKVGGGHAGPNGLGAILSLNSAVATSRASAPALATLRDVCPWPISCSSNCAPRRPRISAL